MSLSAFDFELPESLIALRPAAPRRTAKLLVSTPDGLTDSSVAELASFLRPGDRLVFNDTKVIPARLRGLRRRSESAVAVEATLIERLASDCWRALAKPGRRLKIGDQLEFTAETGGVTCVAAIDAKEEGGAVLLRFEHQGAELDAAIAQIGEPPLPPYIAARRAADAADRDDYQTIFAAKDGAVAAPTAALHFDAAVLSTLEAAGVERSTVTLHVGAGTFLPIKTDRIADHKMHSEAGALDQKAADEINRTRAAGGRIIAVGTTALRVLETAARASGGAGAKLAPWAGATDLFVRPGFEFHQIDGLMTNFHLPKSTLLLLVAGLIGQERLFSVYEHAIRKGYRFYSYGDASLLWPSARPR
ncbi:MAG: tRNA preQ1(34) S-adenosylmethionine ribosyltransferase-isomerase QueA [Neomegalonema sp.]|nr:tRNA preQ1(34) S-adenosylmethionine ribosyltransferase-isomerase QueA [Neomegalonema sp.]